MRVAAALAALVAAAAAATSHYVTVGGAAKMFAPNLLSIASDDLVFFNWAGEAAGTVFETTWHDVCTPREHGLRFTLNSEYTNSPIWRPSRSGFYYFSTLENCAQYGNGVMIEVHPPAAAQ